MIEESLKTLSSGSTSKTKSTISLEKLTALAGVPLPGRPGGSGVGGPGGLGVEKDLNVEDMAFKYLLSYVKLQWHGYEISKHHELIAKHLEAVERGEIDRLMIFMPPRHGKTMLVSEYFPAWYLGRNPDKEIILATYSFDRANDIGRKVRNQLTSPYHKDVFPSCTISPDSKGANKFSTMQGGMYYSVGVGGPITGRGANLFIIDDPIKGREDADSDIAQRKLRDWFRAVAYTRMMSKNAIIVIMTRWTFYDLAGYLLEETAHENWTVLDLPAVADTDNDAIGRKSGQALWPTKYGVQRLERIRATVGSREWNALYQQTPLPDGGGIIDIEWFKKYPYKSWQYVMMPKMLFPSNEYAGDKFRRFLAYKVKSGEIREVNGIICSWDTAYKEKELNDPSACTTWGLAQDRYYLMNVINRRMNFPDLKRAVIQEYERCVKLNAGTVSVLIEDKASGQSLIQELKTYTRIPVIAISPDSNKQVRLSEVSPVIESGRVWIPEQSSWLVAYETQLAQFPYGKFDDMVDSTSQFLRWVSRPRYKRRESLRFWK